MYRDPIPKPIEETEHDWERKTQTVTIYHGRNEMEHSFYECRICGQRTSSALFRPDLTLEDCDRAVVRSVIES